MNATAVLYRLFPDFKQLKLKADDLLKTSKQIYRKGFSLYNYITENKHKIVVKASETLSQAAAAVVGELEKKVKDAWDYFKQDFTAKYDACLPGITTNQTPFPSSINMPDMQKDTSMPTPNSTFNNDPSLAEGSVVESSSDYLANKFNDSGIIKFNLKHLLNDDNYSRLTGFAKTSAMVTDLYSSGYRTKDIKRELFSHNIVGVNNYDDVLQALAFSISNGRPYAGCSYNYLLAEKLGANEQIIKDYESGKSFSEMRSEFGSRTGGMSISYSSYRRLLRKNNVIKKNSNVDTCTKIC